MDIASVGGLARRVAFLSSARSNVHANIAARLLTVDSGNSFRYAPGTDGRVLENQASAIQAMGYDVLNFGEAELRAGPNVLRRLTAGSRPQWVSSNARFTEEQGDFVKSYVILDLSGLRVGILGVTTIPASPVAGAYVQPPEQVLGVLIPKVRRYANIIVVLADLTSDEIDSLTRAGLDIDLLVGGRIANEQIPSKVDRTIVTSAGRYGRGVGRLQLGLDAQGRITQFAGRVHVLR